MVEDETIIEARKKYFETLNEKNVIDHTRIDELDLDNIGIVLNNQQIDLIKFAIKEDKINYKSYQNKLIEKEKTFGIETRDRYLLILKSLTEDEEIPLKTKEVITKIYEQTKVNKTITKDTIIDVLDKLIFKLSPNIQDLIYNKMKQYGVIAKPGIKEMSIDAAEKLFSYIDKDYTAIMIKEEATFNNVVNPNGSYFKNELKNMLDFAYEYDKEIMIGSLIPKTIPTYLNKASKDEIKIKISNYVDHITKYFNAYNIANKRIDRKPVIRSITIFDSPNNSDWLDILSVDDMCDIMKIARTNLKNVNIIYNEEDLENKYIRDHTISIIKEIAKYCKKNKINLVDVVGTKMHVDLDITKEDIIDMFDDLNIYNLKLAITEFDVRPTDFMMENNKREEIEILRERFISDLCNIITNLKISKIINFDSITIDSVCDNQSMMIDIINEKRKNNNEPILKTLYNGMYDNDMGRKEEKFRIINNKNSEKGIADTMYVGIIILSLLIVVSFVILVFLKYV